jgi:DNA polymerase-4
MGAENTFSTDLTDLGAAREALQPLIEKVWRYCETSGKRARTVTVKVKFSDFQQITRSRSCEGGVSSQAELERFSYALLDPVFPPRLGIRLLGVTLSSLDREEAQDDGQLQLSL